MKVTPYEKLSKKARKEADSQKRAGWNGVKPVTKVVPSGKVYSRKEKHRQAFC
jgi:hypothetical protein